MWIPTWANPSGAPPLEEWRKKEGYIPGHTRAILEADPDLRSQLQLFGEYAEENLMAETGNKYFKDAFFVSSCLRDVKSSIRRRQQESGRRRCLNFYFQALVVSVRRCTTEEFMSIILTMFNQKSPCPLRILPSTSVALLIQIRLKLYVVRFDWEGPFCFWQFVAARSAFYG